MESRCEHHPLDFAVVFVCNPDLINQPHHPIQVSLVHAKGENNNQITIRRQTTPQLRNPPTQPPQIKTQRALHPNHTPSASLAKTST
ncbi:MAG: hypothetical protein ACQCN6_00085 [Candidatus Bathyarchaeia archaeon]